jgi:Ca2+-binding RTX toxin-like protein
MRLLLCAFAAVAALLGALPSGAQGEIVTRSGSFLTVSEFDEFYSGPNNVRVSQVGDSWVVTDTSTDFAVQAGVGCFPTGNIRVVRCPATAGDQFFVLTRSGDDDVTIDADVPTLVCGGPGDDHFQGGPGRDTFIGGDGNDTADGGGDFDHLVGDWDCGSLLDGSVGTPGRNVLDGAAGEDVVVGGVGADVLYGGPDRDVLLGDGETAHVPEGGPDVLSGGDGGDFLAGQEGSDVLQGGDGPDELGGGNGDDRLFGGPGDDIVGLGAAFEGEPYFEEQGNDLLDGGPGNDELVGGPGRFLHNASSNFLRVRQLEPVDSGAGNGSDTLVGGDGIDTASYVNRASPQSLTLDGQPNDGSAGEGDMIESDVEQLVGGLADDRLVGADGDETLEGGRGADTLLGGDGNDSLIGGSGEARDSLDGGAGADSLSGGGGEDDLYGRAGGDRLDGGGSSDYLDGGVGADSLDGGNGSDIVSARDGAPDPHVSCGAKIDFALSDPTDKLTDCEESDSSDADHLLVGKSISLRPVHGYPLIRLPDIDRFFPLRSQIDVSVGTTFDATPPRSLVAVTVAGRHRATTRRRLRVAPSASALVSGGELRVEQGKPKLPAADLVLEGGEAGGCRVGGSGGRLTSKVIRGTEVRSDGRFRVLGANSASAGQRAAWIVNDRCDGTETRALNGTVVVTERRSRRRIVVRHGSRHLSKGRR